MESAKNEAYQLGLQEGLNRGRQLVSEGLPSAVSVGNDLGYPPLTYSHYLPAEDEPVSLDEDDSLRSRKKSSAPLIPPSGDPKESGAVQSTYLGPFPGPTTAPPSLHPSENVRPSSGRSAFHTPRMGNVAIPPDNFIPSLDPDNRIRIPPPFEFHRATTPEPQLSPQLPALANRASDSNQEPIPIPPRLNTPLQNKRYRHSRNSSSDSNTSSLSGLEITNQPDYSTGSRTPMTMIPEVSSAYSGSPFPQLEGEETTFDSHHVRSVVRFNDVLSEQ